MSTLVKTWYSDLKGISPDKIFSVAVMPCVAKKYESRRPEHLMENGTPYTDAVLTTRELIWMIKCYGINFNSLPDGEFDRPLGLSSGAGDIFGTTGGVMEAALRTAAELITGERFENLEFTEVKKLMIHDVRIETYYQLTEMGFSDIQLSTLRKMAIHDVTPGYIAEFQAVGLTDLSINRYINFKIS